jgi:hypothetical protein
MPKATVLTPEALNPVSSKAPAAATPPRGNTKEKASPPVEPVLPLQLRLPKPEVKAIKVAAAQSEQTISEFMLACFHAYMQTSKHG